MATPTVLCPPAVPVDAGPPLGLPVLLLIAGCNLIVGSGAMVITGLLTPVSTDFAVSTSVAGQLVTAYAVAFAISAPIVAVLAARVCRKRLLVWALGLNGAAMLCAALAPSFELMWAARALGGVGAAAFVPNASAVVGALADPKRRGRALAIVFGGFTLALVLGAPVGTWVGMLAGWRQTLAGLGLLALVAGLALRRLLPSGIMLTGASVAAFRKVLARHRLLAMIGVNAVAAFGSLSLFTFAAVAFPALLAAPASIVGAALLVFGIGNLLGNMISVWALDKTGPATMATAGFAASALALGVLGFGFERNVAWLALLLWGLFSFAAGTAQQARLVASAPTLAAALLPLNSSATFFGQAVGAFVGGWVLTHASYPAGALAWMASAALGAAALASLALQIVKSKDSS